LKGGYYGRKGHYHNDPEGIKRLHIIKQVLEKKLKQIEAAKILDLSSRQIRRIVKRIREEGKGNGRNNAGTKSIGVGASVNTTLEKWCKWMVPITTGLKEEEKSVCL